MQLYQQAQALLPQAETDYRTLHQFAEVGFDLPRTVDYVHKRLTQMGYTARPCGKSGITAVIGEQQKGDCLLLRCDMDALPIAEETELSFAAANGHMHACGHDMHTAMLLGAAALLQSHAKELPCRVKLCFQPAEETLCGAADMLAHGVMEDPAPQFAVSMHIMTATSVPTGTVIVPPFGIAAPAAAMLRIRMQGKGCHGASPHLGIDPLPAAAHCLLGLQHILTRELPSHTDAALTVGKIAGGTAANAIADFVVMEGSLRAYEDAVLEKLKGRVAEITKQMAAAFGGEGCVTFHGECPTLYNDAQYGAQLLNSLRQALPEALLIDGAAFARNDSQKQKGSEDFACFSHKVPSVMLALAAGRAEEGFSYPLHHPKMRVDLRAMTSGICAYAAAALYHGQHTGASPKP